MEKHPAMNFQTSYLAGPLLAFPWAENFAPLQHPCSLLSVFKNSDAVSLLSNTFCHERSFPMKCRIIFIAHTLWNGLHRLGLELRMILGVGAGRGLVFQTAPTNSSPPTCRRRSLDYACSSPLGNAWRLLACHHTKQDRDINCLLEIFTNNYNSNKG